MKKLLFVLTLLTYVSVSYSDLPCEKLGNCTEDDCKKISQCVISGKCIPAGPCESEGKTGNCKNGLCNIPGGWD